MLRDIYNFVVSCYTRQQMKDVHHHPAGLLQSLTISDLVFEYIGRDFSLAYLAQRENRLS